MGWKTDLVVVDRRYKEPATLLNAFGLTSVEADEIGVVEEMFPPECLLSAEYKDCTLLAQPSITAPILSDPTGTQASSIIAATEATRVCCCVLHSVVNLAAFALYENGECIRAFGASSDDGVFLDEGEQTSIEAQFLANYTELTRPEEATAYIDSSGETLELGEIGEDLVFEVLATFLGQRPDFSEDLLDMEARKYKKSGLLKRLFNR